jgi:hypothetical protein
MLNLTLGVTSASVNNIDDGKQLNQQELVYIQSKDFLLSFHLYLFHVYNYISQRQCGNLFPDISGLYAIYSGLRKFNIALANSYSHRQCHMITLCTSIKRACYWWFSQFSAIIFFLICEEGLTSDICKYNCFIILWFSVICIVATVTNWKDDMT